MKPVSLFARFLAFVALATPFLAEIHGQDDDASPPSRVVTIDGITALSVVIVDFQSDADARRAPLRERLLQGAFRDALKQSSLRYAYSLSFHPGPRKEGIPELELEIREWTYSAGAFECTVRGVYTDGDGERHDLKGTVGVELTVSMSDVPEDVEEHLQSSATKAFLTLLNRVKKKRLYPFVVP